MINFVIWQFSTCAQYILLFPLLLVSLISFLSVPTHTSPIPTSPFPDSRLLVLFSDPFNLTRATYWSLNRSPVGTQPKATPVPAFNSKHLSGEGKGPLSLSSTHGWLELMVHSWQVFAVAVDLWLEWLHLTQKVIFHKAYIPSAPSSA